jgi:4-amino-4-deoxy-L-arabinose transferase-like glycosyltransferase
MTKKHETMNTRWHWACLLAVGLLVLTIQLGNTHLWDQDEGFYAATAAEMIAANDWITPTFNGKLFAHKPPMMFWGMMLGYECFGLNELGARFASSIFGVLTMLTTYAIARKLFDAWTGLFAGLAIGSCIMFTMVARSATADAHLTFFVLLALYLWVNEYVATPGVTRNERLGGMRWRAWIAAYAVMGLGVLTKGPIGFLFPMAIIGLFLLTEQMDAHLSDVACGTKGWKGWLSRLYAYTPVPFLQTVWKMRPMTAFITILAVSAPWYALVQWQTEGAFLREFIGVHHLGRFSGAMDNHSGPIYYYVLACLVGMYPWSAFAIPALHSWWRASQSLEQTRSIRFVSCWALVYIAIFSMASTKLPNYVLPAYPALAILIGRYFAVWTRDKTNVHAGWLNAGWILLVVVGAILLIGIPSTTWIAWQGQTLLDRMAIETQAQRRIAWLGVVGLPLVVFGIFGLGMLIRNRTKIAAGAFATAAVAMMLILSQFVAPELDRFQQMQAVAQSWKQAGLGPQVPVAMLDCFRPSMVFYYQREIHFCDTPEQAIEWMRGNHQSILIASSQQYELLRNQLPENYRILRRVSQFPTQEELVVVGDLSMRVTPRLARINK